MQWLEEPMEAVGLTDNTQQICAGSFPCKHGR